LLECGQLGRVDLKTARRVAGALEVRLEVMPRWRGGELARVVDQEHAAIVERVAARLRAAGWEIQAEYTFNHFGERGSVDLVAWHGPRQAVLLVEVKTRLTDIQDLLASFGRKTRIVPGAVAAERGWGLRELGPSSSFRTRQLPEASLVGTGRPSPRHCPEERATCGAGFVTLEVALQPCGSSRSQQPVVRSASPLRRAASEPAEAAPRPAIWAAYQPPL
jgi:hypothetical protein